MTEHDKQAAWTVLTNHGRVLMLVASDPEILVREIADRLGITERSVLRIIGELEDTGHVSHVRIGNRNRYRVHDGAGRRSDADLDPELLVSIAAPDEGS